MQKPTAPWVLHDSPLTIDACRACFHFPVKVHSQVVRFLVKAHVQSHLGHVHAHRPPNAVDIPIQSYSCSTFPVNPTRNHCFISYPTGSSCSNCRAREGYLRTGGALMPPKVKHKNANQHEKRHDTGLAPPGKRISKDKLPSTVNGNANGKPANPVQPPPLPSSGLNQGLTFSHSAPQPDTTPPGASDDRVEIERAERKDSLPTDGAVDEVVTLDMGTPGPTERTSSESRCVGDGQTLRSLGSQASSTLAFAVTILRSCPLRDAVAILILLLSLPPTLIITVHALFSSLTLVTPSIASFNWTSWTSLHAFGSWFTATQGGGPSPFTILLADTMAWILYMVLPRNAQSFMLDFGQVVIAISLSGATADKGTSSNSVALCSAIIAILHLSRYKSLHLTGMDYLRSFLQGLGLTVPGDSSASSRFISSTGTVHGLSLIHI